MQEPRSLRLFIFAGVGPAFGTGHIIRMRELKELLDPASSLRLTLEKSENEISQELACSPFLKESKKGGRIKTELRSFSDTKKALAELRKIGESPCLFLLDLRELDPSPFLEKGAVLSLDNYHPLRGLLEKQNRTRAGKTILFHDTLPHPHSGLRQIFEQALISPYLLSPAYQRKKGDPQAKRRALFSAGAFQDLPDIFPLFSKFSAQRPCPPKEKGGSHDPNLHLWEEVFWLGKESKDQRLWPFLSFIESMPRQKFWEYLRESQDFFCYPGMALLEALFLGRLPALFSTESITHNRLSRYLKEEAGLVYLEEESIEPQKFLRDYSASRALLEKRKKEGWGPSGRGYAILLQKLEALLA